MNRILHALAVVLCFELGALLIFLPWSQLWEQNYFLSRFPVLIPIMLHPSLRGAVTGLGVLNIALAIEMIKRRPQPAREARQ